MPRTYWRVIDPSHEYLGQVGYHTRYFSDGQRELKIPGRATRFCADDPQLERVYPAHLQGVVRRDLRILPDVNGRRRWLYKDIPIVEYCAADVILDSGGKRDKDVAAHIQEALDEGKIGAKLITNRKGWQLEYRGEVLPFNDLMILKR